MVNIIEPNLLSVKCGALIKQIGGKSKILYNMYRTVAPDFHNSLTLHCYCPSQLIDSVAMACWLFGPDLV